MFHPYFSQAAKYARIIYYDQRGVGQSDHDPTGQSYTVKQAVEDLDNLRKALKVDKWIVLGHSYGGFLAQCYALEHPEHVLGLVLVCAEPGTPNVPLDRTRQRDYMTDEELAKVMSIYGNDKLEGEQKVYNGHLNGDWKRQNFYKPTSNELARTVRYEWKPGPGFRERICPVMSRIDLEGKFANFDLPTLIVEAKWDLTWNTDKPEKMLKNHPGAKMVMFERSGHSPFADETDEFFPTLRDFVNTAKSTPTPAPDRMGKGVPWPSPILSKIDVLPWTGAGDKALEAFESIKTSELTDSIAWLKLAMTLYDGKYYEEALEAFRRAGQSAKGEVIRFACLVWQGHLLDILDRRAEALDAYNRALAIDIGDESIQHDQYDMIIDRKWVEERLKTPFVRK